MMELRTLRYFVEVVRQKSYTLASQKLFVTQPTLSRQVADLEEELGQQLLERSTRHIVPTEKGLQFYRRAVEILALAKQAKEEAASVESISGDLTIAAGELPCMTVIAAALAGLQKKHPAVRCHFLSVTADIAAQNVRTGLADLAVISADAGLSGLDSLPMPNPARWGVLMRRDEPLGAKRALTAEELKNLEVFIPRRLSEEETGYFSGWAGCSIEEIPVKGTYNLLYNAALAVKQGAHALCIDGVAKDDELVFVPLEPELQYPAVAAWAAGRTPSPLLRAMLAEIKVRLR